MLDTRFSFWKNRDYLWAKLTVSVAALALVGGVLHYYLHAQYENVIRVKRQQLERTVSSLELRLHGSLLAVRLLAADSDVSSLEPARIQQKLEKAVITLGLQNAALFDVNGELIVDANGNHPREVFDSISFGKALNRQSLISNRIIPGNWETAYVSLRTPVYNQYSQVNAVLAAAIPLSDVSFVVQKENMPKGQYVFIMDANGQFLYHPRLQQIYPEETAYFKHIFPIGDKQTVTRVETSVLDAVEKVFIYRQLDHTMWRAVYAVPLRTVYWETLKAAMLDILVVILLITIITLGYRFLKEASRNSEMLDNLRIERLSAATEMAAGIAHEVRNPLTSIKGFIQLMMQKEDKTNFNNYLEIVLGEINRIDALIGEFQTLARPLRLPVLVKTDLSKVITDVVLLMESHAEQKQAVLEYVSQGELFDGSGLWVKADIAQIKQVLINLLRNAFDAVADNGRVRITLIRTQEMAAIVIEDNGPGISPEILKKLGTPFFTTKEGGTGLGLSVCYTIIHNHGGKIKVASKVGEGATFTVLLPLLREED